MEQNPANRWHGSDPDLYLVGAGVSFPEHLTLQAIETLTACTRIFTNIPESELDILPENIRTKCHSLWSLYQENRDRVENYGAVVEAVINAAEAQRPFAWMTPGHPLVFDSVSQALMVAGHERGWHVCALPGISCLDTILAEIGYDPAGGLLVHDANSLVMQKLSLVPSFATLLLQPSAFGSSLAHLTSQWQPDLSPLRDYLRDFYAGEHKCAFVHSSSKSGGMAQIYWKNINDLTSVPFDALAGSTMFVPPEVPELSVKSAPSVASQLAKKVSSGMRSQD